MPALINMAAQEVLRLAIWLTLLTVLFVPIERFFGDRPRARSRQDVLIDLAYFALSSVAPAVLLAIPVAALAYCAKLLVPAQVHTAVASLPGAVRTALAFVVAETGFYWGHRLSHQIPWLWRFHAVHHSTEELYFLSNTRTHPVDLVVTRLFGLAPLYLLGLASPSAAASVTPAAVIVGGTIWGFFIHANVRWRFGPLEALVTTPAFHHWHHSRYDHINHNYASTLPILDRIFGTHHLPSKWPAEYGTDTAQPSTFMGQLLVPIVKKGEANRDRNQGCETSGAQ